MATGHIQWKTKKVIGHFRFRATNAGLPSGTGVAAIFSPSASRGVCNAWLRATLGWFTWPLCAAEGNVDNGQKRTLRNVPAFVVFCLLTTAHLQTIVSDRWKPLTRTGVSSSRCGTGTALPPTISWVPCLSEFQASAVFERLFETCLKLLLSGAGVGFTAASLPHQLFIWQRFFITRGWKWPAFERKVHCGDWDFVTFKIGHGLMTAWTNRVSKRTSPPQKPSVRDLSVRGRFRGIKAEITKADGSLLFFRSLTKLFLKWPQTI